MGDGSVLDVVWVDWALGMHLVRKIHSVLIVLIFTYFIIGEIMPS